MKSIKPIRIWWITFALFVFAVTCQSPQIQHNLDKERFFQKGQSQNSKAKRQNKPREQAQESSATPNEQKQNAFRQLLQAIRSNDHHKTLEALAQGADPNGTDAKGATPLIHTAVQGNPRIAAVLLRRGAKVDKGTPSGLTPLMIASWEGHLHLVFYLLGRGASVNARTNNGATALMFAAQEGHRKIVRYLVFKGARVSLVSADGSTALELARIKGHEKIASFLRQKGAKR
jgi:serine/threonine-protein phosphatase 6 regulatory ankyrin repeat subunit B